MFKENAQRHWDAGLPVMPLRPNSKVPALPAWQTLCAKMPDEDDRGVWLEHWGDGNMGLPLGPQAGMIVLDVDSVDPRVDAVLEAVMPKSPWRRVGKKGAVYAFKYSGERTYRIKDSTGATIMEVLSRGAQVVLPPSIHPDTNMPYTANCDLVSVLDQLPPLPLKFEEDVRQALINAGFDLQTRGATKITTWVAAGGRDSSMVAFAGLQARAVIHRECTLQEALDQMAAWVESYTQKVEGDDLDIGKGQKKVLEFLRRDVTENGRRLPKGWDVGLSDEDLVKMQDYFGEEAEAWDSKAFMDYIHKRVADIGPDDVFARQEMVKDILLKMSQSEHLTSVDQDVILSFVQAATGRLVTVAALRRQLKDLSSGAMTGENHTEVANALIRDLSRAGEIRFWRGDFFQWFGAHWRKMAEDEIYRHLSKEFGSLPAARRFNDHKGIISIMQKALAAPLADEDEIIGINFANGFLTSDMVLRPHEPRFGCDYVLPYRYMPDQMAPSLFLAFLDQCWGEDEDYLEKIQALREIIAVTLFRRATAYQRAFCIWGLPGTGKSELVSTVLGLIPAGSRCSVAPTEWGDRFMPSLMRDALVNHCGELSETTMIPGAQFKMIVEGTEMMGQQKGRDIFHFRPLCAQWFSSNHLPKTRDSSDGFNRRWLFLTFNKVCPPDQRRIDIHKEFLAEEIEAIVAWAIPAIRDVIRQAGYTLPASHLAALEETATSNNSVRFFMTSGDAVKIEKGSGSLPESFLYSQYVSFCRVTAQTMPVSMRRFRNICMELQSSLEFRVVTVRDGVSETTHYEDVQVARKAREVGRR